MPNELFLQISVSLDGYIEDAKQSIEWMAGDTSVDPLHTATLRSIDGMIFGRKAHALLAEFWPKAAESDGASPDLIEQARLMNALPKYVLTHGGEKTGWARSHSILLTDMPRLKVDAQRPIALFAGAEAAQQTLSQGLVDEIRLIQYPILLSDGTPLFAKDPNRRSLTFVDSRTFDSGAILCRYRVKASERG